MESWTFYLAFIGSFLSVTLLSYLAWKEHNPEKPRTLSMLAAEKRQLLAFFRAVLWICGTLFSITVFFYIVPRIANGPYITSAWIIGYISEVLLGVFPAKGSIEKLLHNIFSRSMAFGMLATVFIFAISLHGNFAIIEGALTIVMTILASLTILDGRKFIFYELPFVYLSHASILLAALAVR